MEISANGAFERLLAYCNQQEYSEVGETITLLFTALVDDHHACYIGKLRGLNNEIFSDVIELLKIDYLGHQELRDELIKLGYGDVT
ncbi:MAG: hypothetical protein ACYCZC_04365 [Acidithiobacillus sp.]